MPHGERSEMTETAIAVADAFMVDVHTVAEELGAIPLMQEQITHQEYRRRFAAMTQQQRLDEMRRIGVPAILRLMKGG